MQKRQITMILCNETGEVFPSAAAAAAAKGVTRGAVSNVLNGNYDSVKGLTFSRQPLSCPLHGPHSGRTCPGCWNEAGYVRAHGGHWIDRNGKTRTVESLAGYIYVSDPHKVLDTSTGNLLPVAPFRKDKVMWMIRHVDRLTWDIHYPTGTILDGAVNVSPGDPAFEYLLDKAGRWPLANGDFWTDYPSRGPGAFVTIGNRTYINSAHGKGGR